MTLHDFELAKSFFTEGRFYYAILNADVNKKEYKTLREFVSKKDLQLYDDAWNTVMKEKYDVSDVSK